MKPQHLVTLFSLAAVAAGCDSNSTGVDDVGIGRFEADLSGEVGGRFDGAALSTETVAGYHDLIVLEDPAGDFTMLIYHADDRFIEGRESITDNTDLAYDRGIVAELIVGGRYFVATGGSVVLDEVSTSGIDGTARVTAVEVDEAGNIYSGSTVSVDAAFRTDFDPDQAFFRAAAPGSGARPMLRVAKLP